jgi:hypothetical protein
MQYIDEYLEGKDFSRETVLVCGASVMLLHDLYEAPQTDFIIGCNHHAIILKPDMVVALDQHTMPLLEEYRGVVCAKHDDADVNIGMAPSFGFSGAAAVWLADYMGFAEVLIAGFSCYLDGGRSYWHDHTKVVKPHVATTAQQQNDIWGIVRCSLKNPDRVSVISGYLQKTFKPWSKHEHTKACEDREYRSRKALCYHGGRGKFTSRP